MNMTELTIFCLVFSNCCPFDFPDFKIQKQYFGLKYSLQISYFFIIVTI